MHARVHRPERCGLYIKGEAGALRTRMSRSERRSSPAQILGANTDAVLRALRDLDDAGLERLHCEGVLEGGTP